MKIEDILSIDVPNKYYLRPEIAKRVIETCKERLETLKEMYPFVIHDGYNSRISSEDGQIAPTLTTECRRGGRGGINIIEMNNGNYRVRRLTPNEAAKFQGFDSFKVTVPEGEVYKQVGNAVTVTVAKAVAQQIKLELGDLGMKVNSFFSGCGGFDLGFIQAGFEITGAWDFDKYAVESYRHNIGDHVKQMSVLDMTGADVPQANGWLFGFPCQDISVAGKQAGMVKGETRSGLFYEIMRLLGEVSDKPEWILAENVKAVNKFIPTIREEYEKAGYKLVDPQLYNSKFWGVPQNRERYFLMGIRSDLVKSFVFPTQQTDFIPKLSSVLESDVDEKYYISDEKAAKIIEQAIDGLRIKEATKKGYATATEGDTINISHPNSKTRRGRVGKQVAQTLLTGTEQVVVETVPELNRIGGLYDTKEQRRQAGAVWDKEGLAPTLKTPSGGYSEPMIITVGNTNPSGRGMNGNVFDSEGLAPTLTTNKGEGVKTLINYRVRKLTPREYARLQGFPDTYEQVVSNSQFYKQMGNAVTVNVSYAIAKAIKEQF